MTAPDDLDLDLDPEVSEIPVLDLTDEELAVLAGIDGPVVLPYLGDLDHPLRNTALTTAYRSLGARGLLEDGGPLPGASAAGGDRVGADGPPAPNRHVRMPEELAHLLTLRASAEQVVCAALTTALGQEYRYAHLAADVALLELVTDAGLHRFSFLDRDAVPSLVERWVLHPRAVPGPGDAVVVPPGSTPDATPPDAVLEALGGQLLRTDLVVRRADDGGQAELFGVFSGPRGTFAGSVRYGSGAAVRIEPTTPAQVRQQIRRLLRVSG